MPIASSNEIHVKYVLDTSQLQAATQAMSGITAEERKLLAALKTLQNQLNNTGAAGTNAGNNIAGSLTKISDVAKALIPTLGAAFAADKIRQFALYAFETAKQFEQMGKTLAFVTGSSQKAAEQLSYMTALAQSLGLNVRALADGFKGFAAAASFAGVSQESINRQMVAFTKAAAALSLSAEDTKLMFNALSQMYSKNKIQAEELRGQLGERLPGAMELLAKSMGKPVTALDEMLKKGEIITKDVMPAFAKEVELAFGIAADQTDTLTAAQNKMFSAIEIAATRIMDGGIGDFIKTLFNSIATVSQYLGSLVQDNYQNQVDYNNRLKVEAEKNVLYEIEQKRKQYKEVYGIELSAQDAARALLEDAKTGEKAYYEWYKGQLRDIEESANSSFDRVIRGAHKAFGTIGDVALSPIKLATAMVKDALAPLTGAEGDAMVKLFTENWEKRGAAINKYSQSEVEAGKARLDKLKSFEQNAITETNTFNDEAAKERDKQLKEKYQKELQFLELQERIRKLYAEANIENEHQRSQALIKIAVDFNNKKAEVDKKYNLYSQFSESEGSKELRKLTQNNYDLRLAESASFNSDLRRNEDKYHKEAYDAALKQYAKMEEAQKKAANKTEKIAKSEFEKELQTSEDSYSELIKQLEDSRDEETRREGLSYQQRINLFTYYTDLINQTWEDRNKAKNDITAKYAAKDVAELAKMYQEDYQNSIRRFDNQMRLLETNLDTMQLQEKNAMRERNADQQQLLLLEKNQADERIDLQMYRLQKEAEENKKYADMGVEEAANAYNQNMADLRNLEEQKTAIARDYADQRTQYEISVMQSAFDFASNLVNEMTNLQNAKYDNDLKRIQNQADEEIRLADGNKQKIMAINQKRQDEERRIRKAQFESQRAAAIADVVFKTAPLIAQYTAGILTGPLAIIALAAQAAQIGFIMAQPVPEYRKGTQGKRHKGGPAIVGEEGVEKVVTESGRVYYTPPTATLLDLPKGAEVIPNKLLNKQEVYWASNQSGAKKTQQVNLVEAKLDEIGGILKGLPIHQINMDERGFEKFVRTERRTTKILNNRFPTK